MNKSTLQTVLAFCVALGIVLASLAYVLLTYNVTFSKKQSSDTSKAMMTEREAREIAERSCIKGGESVSSPTYNEYTKTWWFDANLNSAHEGCSPACVVNEQTKTAEINYRCTGVKNPDTKQNSKPDTTSACGVENCHGMNIVCGSHPAEMCTEMYQLGDKCRQYAECGVVNGACQQVENPKFTECKNCVYKCETLFPNNPDKASNCESACGE